jgi:hypothetical protein
MIPSGITIIILIQKYKKILVDLQTVNIVIIYKFYTIYLNINLYYY